MANPGIKFEIPRPPEEDLKRTPPTVLAYINALEEIIAKLVKAVNDHGVAVDKLQKELRESKRQAAPFRSKKKKDKKKRKKPGRKGGHQQSRRPEPEHVDKECHAPHSERCTCGGLVETVDSYVQFQEDIEPRVVIRKFVVTIGQCVDCHRSVEGRHPLQTSTARGNADRQIGPTALALAADLHYRLGVSFEKICEHLKHLGLEVETSTLVRAMERIAGRAEATFLELMQKVLEQDVLHIDETGWWVDGEPFYLWVLSGAEATIYFVRKTRSSDEVADFLKDFAGVFVSDGAKAYDKLGKVLTRALCLLHLRRNVVALEEKQTKGAVRFPRAVISWLDAAIELVGKRDQMVPQKYQRKAKRLENKFLRLIQGCATNEANGKMLQRLEQWQDAVLRCLRDPRVPATNNHGERQIRPGVVLRKRGGCNRSERGAWAFEILTSILTSCRQMGVNAVEWTVELLRQPIPRAPFPFWLTKEQTLTCSQ